MQCPVWRFQILMDCFDADASRILSHRKGTIIEKESRGKSRGVEEGEVMKQEGRGDSKRSKANHCAVSDDKLAICTYAGRFTQRDLLLPRLLPSDSSRRCVRRSVGIYRDDIGFQ